MDKCSDSSFLSTGFVLDRGKNMRTPFWLTNVCSEVVQNRQRLDTSRLRRLLEAIVLTTLFAIEKLAFRDAYE
jgi:hypothetical protein